MSTPDVCPCGSESKLSDCCLPYLTSRKEPPTAEALLRSRYTAFTRGDVDYILETHHTRTRGEIKRDEVEAWSKGSEWLGLRLLEKEGGEATDDRGTIVFHARYVTEGRIAEHYEKSHFEKEDGRWRFLDAESVKTAPIRRTEPKVGRNDPCPCGSGKKHKKCCGSAA